MIILRAFTKLFLFPGSLALSLLDIPVDSDGGIFRSLINMLFWGLLGAMILLPILLK